jgi:hypothetical protein
MKVILMLRSLCVLIFIIFSVTQLVCFGEPIQENNIGPALTEETGAAKTQKDDADLKESKELVLSKLFYIPTANVLSALDIHVNAGSTIGVSQELVPQANLGLGLGGIAELYVSSKELLTNIVGIQSIVNTGMLKILVYGEKKRSSKIALGLKLSGNIQEVSGIWALDGSNLKYDSRFTELFVVGSKNIGIWSVHAGVSLFDVRIYNFYLDTVLINKTELSEDKANSFSSILLGVKKTVNKDTFLIIELGGTPKHEYNATDVSFNVIPIYVLMGGVRTKLNRRISIDAGAKYQSDYAGLADTSIRVVFNVIFSVRRKDPYGWHN